MGVVGEVIHISPVLNLNGVFDLLWKKKGMSAFVIWYINACVYYIVVPVI